MSKPIAVCCLLGVLACDPPSTPPAVDAAAGTEVASFPAGPRPLDLLFVVDDSPSTADKQAALVRAFPLLAAQLATVDGGVPDLHLGVISPDLGTQATSSATPAPTIGQIGNGGCAGAGKAGALLAPTGLFADLADRFARMPRGAAANFTGTLSEAFARMATLGAGGCGFEQPLSAIRAALTNPMNAGFVRAEASLAVIVLTDEDDCSVASTELFGPESAELGPLQSFRCFRFGVECAPDDVTVVGVKTGCRPRAASTLIDDVMPTTTELLAAKGGDARKLMLGVIAGATEPVEIELRSPPGGGTPQVALANSCRFTTAGGPAVADPPVRLAAWLAGFEGKTELASICSDDLSPAATAIGAKLKALLGDRCLDRAVTADDGCVVVDQPAGSAEVELPPCGAAPGETCYRVVDDAGCSHGQALEIERPAPAPADTWTTMRCP